METDPGVLGMSYSIFKSAGNRRDFRRKLHGRKWRVKEISAIKKC